MNEPFSQADSSSTRQVGGLGLGLSLYIALLVAEASGGRLQVNGPRPWLDLDPV